MSRIQVLLKASHVWRFNLYNLYCIESVQLHSKDIFIKWSTRHLIYLNLKGINNKLTHLKKF